MYLNIVQHLKTVHIYYSYTYVAYTTYRYKVKQQMQTTAKHEKMETTKNYQTDRDGSYKNGLTLNTMQIKHRKYNLHGADDFTKDISKAIITKITQDILSKLLVSFYKAG